MKGKGNLEFEASKDVLTESGKALMNIVPKEDPNKLFKYSNLATQQFVADLNGDKIPEVVIGGFNGYFFAFNGEKVKDKNGFSDGPVFLKDTEGKMLKVNGKSSPHLVDWDKDGDLDLISGSNGGAISIATNVGSPKEARWAPFKELIPAIAKSGNQQLKAGEKAKRGQNARLCVVDYNGDGLLDIVTGDNKTLSRVKAGMTVEKIAARRKLASEYKKFEDALRANESIEASVKLLEIRELGRKVRELQSGHMSKQKEANVWVYLQKSSVPVEAPAKK